MSSGNVFSSVLSSSHMTHQAAMTCHDYLFMTSLQWHAFPKLQPDNM